MEKKAAKVLLDADVLSYLEQHLTQRKNASNAEYLSGLTAAYAQATADNVRAGIELGEKKIRNNYAVAHKEKLAEIIDTELDAIRASKARIAEDSEKERIKWSTVLSDVDPFLVELDDERRKYEYLTLIDEFESWTRRLDTAMAADKLEDTLHPYNSLLRFSHRLARMSYVKLHTLCRERVENIYTSLIQRYSEKLKTSLDDMQWPQTFGNKLKKPTTYNKGLMLFRLMFCLMVDLQSPYDNENEDNADDESDGTQALRRRPSIVLSLLPLSLMLEPLQKRFKFHFSGRRETNRIDKPEWMYTFLLNILKGHIKLLTCIIQPLLDQRNMSTNAVTVFTHGLIKLVNKKLEFDMDKFLASRELLSHVIAETLAFERELKGVYMYPTDLPISVHVFTGDQDRVDLWLKYEKAYAFAKLETMMDSPTAITFKFSNVEGMKNLRPTVVAGDVSLLFQSVTQRYRGLSDVSLQYQFISHIQIRVLDRFLNELEDTAFKYYEDLDEALDRQEYFMLLINSVYYLYTVVAECSEQVFFMDIYERLRTTPTYDVMKLDRKKVEYIRSEKNKAFVEGALSGSESEGYLSDLDIKEGSKSDSDMSGGYESNTKVVNGESAENGIFDFGMGLWGSSGSAGSAGGGGVFKGILKKYRAALEDLLDRLVQSALDSVDSKFKPYRRQQWMVPPFSRAAAQPDVSQMACEPFQYIKDFMTIANSTLASPLFNHSWPKLTGLISKHLMNEVVCENFFNAGGAKQLQTDAACLFRIFKLYTNKPENFFKHLKEAILLLNLPSNVIAEMKVKLITVHGEDEDETEQVLDDLASLGVHRLTADQALTILGRYMGVKS
eukprot:CFRG0650T1